MVKSGAVERCSDDDIVDEIEMLIAAIDAPVMLYSDSATNLLPLHGKLPEDKNKMLAIIHEYKSKGVTERLMFRFQSRLESFVGQYGRLTPDIEKLIPPLMKGKKLHLRDKEYAETVIAAIYDKLMPCRNYILLLNSSSGNHRLMSLSFASFNEYFFFVITFCFNISSNTQNIPRTSTFLS